METQPCPSYFVFNMFEMFNYFLLIHLPLNCPKTLMCSVLRGLLGCQLCSPSFKGVNVKPSSGGQNRCRFKSWLHYFPVVRTLKGNISELRSHHL